VSGLFSRLIARTLRTGPSLRPSLPTGFENWATEKPAASLVEEAESYSAPATRIASSLGPIPALPPSARHAEHRAGRGLEPIWPVDDQISVPRLQPQSQRRGRTAQSPAITEDNAVRRAPQADPRRQRTIDAPLPPRRERLAALPAELRSPRLPPAPEPSHVTVAAEREARPKPAADEPSMSLSGPPVRRSEVTPAAAPLLTAPAVRAAAAASADAGPEVKISIGCVEVRSTPQTAPPPKARPRDERPPPIRLADYLAQRRTGGR
jgi:hypothetical protein